VSFCGKSGERLPWFVRPDSLTANGDHAIVIAPGLVSIEAVRIEHTYELLIVRHELRAAKEGARPRISSRLVFRAWQGQLPLDLVEKDRSVAGKIAPEFFTWAGEPRQLPAQFVEAVHAIVVAVNCRNCGHAHLLVEPKPPLVTVPPVTSSAQMETLQDKRANSAPSTTDSMASAVV